PNFGSHPYFGDFPGFRSEVRVRAEVLAPLPAAHRLAYSVCMSMHGEYKVPGGKLVVVDFELVDGKIDDFRLSGDFFLEPDDALGCIDAAVVGLSPNNTIEEFGTAIQAALPSEVHLLG